MKNTTLTGKLHSQGYFWIGWSTGLLLAIVLSLVVYLQTKGAYASDGFEQIGYPFAFHLRGGFGGQTFVYWWALVLDFGFGLVIAFLAGCFFARVRSILKLVLSFLAVPFGVYYLRNLSSVDEIPKLKAMIIIVAVLGSIAAIVEPNLRIGPLAVAGLYFASFAATALKLTQNPHTPSVGWWLTAALMFAILIVIPFRFLNWISLWVHNRRGNRNVI